MIRVVIEIHGEEGQVDVQHARLTAVEVGMFLLQLQNAKKTILKEWKEVRE